MAKGHRSQIKAERNAVMDTRPSAKLSYAGVSVQKACFVLDAIRGKGVEEALAIVKYNPRYVSKLVEKLIRSAMANAENNNGMDINNLYIEECYANKMGQKVNPHGLRVGIIKDWDSKWYADKNFADALVEDYNIRKYLKKETFSAGVSKIEIERASERLKITLHTGKPGMVIGQGGKNIDELKKKVEKLTEAKKITIDVKEIKRADRDAQLVAENIAKQLEERVSFRRAMKSCMSRTMKSGAKGIKASCSGRLGGADMARTEFYSEGTIPLQTLRADIDYGFAEADTTYGKVGVKVWIYNGEVLPAKTKTQAEPKSEGGEQ